MTDNLLGAGCTSCPANLAAKVRIGSAFYRAYDGKEKHAIHRRCRVEAYARDVQSWLRSQPFDDAGPKHRRRYKDLLSKIWRACRFKGS